MNLEELLDTMQDEMHSAHEEVEKFISGNKSAGTRLRKNMQDVKKFAQAIRSEVQEQKNAVMA